MQSSFKELPGGRVVSIDAIRGFDMFWIIGGGTLFLRLFKLVDNPVTRGFANQLHHVPWHGFHFEDLIFPLFLFIMGASMPFSLSKRINRGESRKNLYLHIVKRSLILYILGLIYYGLLDFNLVEQRYAGILPRIAVCYFFTALIVMNSRIKGQALWAGLILIIYGAALKMIPVPGYEAGVF